MGITLKKARIVKLEAEGFAGLGVAIRVTFQPLYQPTESKEGELLPFGTPIPVESVRWWSEETGKKLTEFIVSAEKDIQKNILGEDEAKAIDSKSKGLVMPEEEIITGLGNVPPTITGG